jgi:Transposase
MPRASTVHPVIAIGIDLGKSAFHMIGLDSRGAIVLRKKVSRGRIASRLANPPPCLIGIEAGMATHYVARELTALGHDVKQVPATYAKRFRQGHKNDFRDAHAVAEAVQRPTTRFVPARTDDRFSVGQSAGTPAILQPGSRLHCTLEVCSGSKSEVTAPQQQWRLPPQRADITRPELLVSTTSEAFSRYAAATLAPSKGRLIR